MQGSLFRSENDIYSRPPSENDIFPSLTHFVFRLPSWPFCLNSSLFCINFTLLFPLFSFLFPFFLFRSPFFLFLLHLPPFFSWPFHIFSPKWHRLIFPLRGGGIFQYIDPCTYDLQLLYFKYLFKRNRNDLICIYQKGTFTKIFTISLNDG
jgi:hypothetical protein